MPRRKSRPRRIDAVVVDDACAICTERMEHQWVYRAPSCSHVFHFECLDEWMKQSGTCPLCRAPLTFLDKILQAIGNPSSFDEASRLLSHAPIEILDDNLDVIEYTILNSGLPFFKQYQLIGKIDPIRATFYDEYFADRMMQTVIPSASVVARIMRKIPPSALIYTIHAGLWESRGHGQPAFNVADGLTHPDEIVREATEVIRMELGM